MQALILLDGMDEMRYLRYLQQRMIQAPPRTTESFIFLAEDDIDDQELLIEALAEIDDSIVVKTVANGKKAINFLEQLPSDERPSLIILDYNLPELSGADILKQLLQTEKFGAVNKVVWSTSNPPVYERLCLELGAKAYMVKPSDISGIQRIAEFILRMSRSGNSSLIED